MFDGDALTAEEVAEMLRVSKNSVYRLAQSGVLASYRVGKKTSLHLARRRGVHPLGHAFAEGRADGAKPIDPVPNGRRASPPRRQLTRRNA